AREFLQECWQRVEEQLAQETQVDAFDMAPLGTLARRLNVLAGIGGRAPELSLLRCLVKRLPRLNLPGIWATAEILRPLPSAEWVESLREVWAGQLHPPVWVDSDRDPNLSLDPELESAAYSVLAALGACAACFPGAQNFDADEAVADEADTIADELDALLEELELLEEENDSSKRDDLKQRV